MNEQNARRAVVTGGSRGLGLALTRALTDRGWHVVIDGRDAEVLATAVAALPHPERVTAIAGDVSDPTHRATLAAAAGPSLDLLANNASVLGAVPMPTLADHPLDAFVHALAVNTVAPLHLAQVLLPALRRVSGRVDGSVGGRVINVTSDAAVSAYAHWGAYGATKAALDLLTAVLAEENPGLRWYALDPGDMATDLAAAAGEDPAGRPAPETVVPSVLRLVDGVLPSGRYTAAELAPIGAAR
jgi:NAD(P)-dependent dehydrogenase (short-subunit alcohol dehydrogenase family)